MKGRGEENDNDHCEEHANYEDQEHDDDYNTHGEK
jgi:hypothetical protein